MQSASRRCTRLEQGFSREDYEELLAWQGLGIVTGRRNLGWKRCEKIVRKSLSNT